MDALLSEVDIQSTSAGPQTDDYFTYDPEVDSPSPPLFAKIGMSLIMCCGIIGNSLIIFQFVKSRLLRSAPNMFIINLALADLVLIVCMGPQIHNMVAYGGRQGYGDLGCFCHAFLIVTSAGASLVSMGFIAVSRYLIIVHPQKKILLSWWLCGVLCVCCWVYSILVALPAVFGWGRFAWVRRNYICNYDWTYNMAYNGVVFFFLFGIVSAIMFYCYYNIYKVFRESKQRIAVEGVKGKGPSKDEMRLAIQLLVIFIIYNICWTPYLAISLFIDPIGQRPEWLHCIFIMLAYWNSAVNILVYLYYNRVFRGECLHLARMKINSDSSITVSTSISTKK